jgi:mRNA interferase HicA
MWLYLISIGVLTCHHEARDLMKRLAQIAKAQGIELRLTEGANHTKVIIGNRIDVVPRHTEINEMTAKAIIRKLEGRS